MLGATMGISPGASRLLAATILLLHLVFLVSPVLSYRGDISRARLPPQLARGPAGVPGLVSREKNPFSPHASSRRKKRDGTGGGVAPKVEGEFEDVTAEQCIGMGLEKCGDLCVAQCCNVESSLACPVNSYCTANDEYEFCCENGHTCDEPVECLNLDDAKCDNKAGELVVDGGEEKACCYTGFEVCTTIWDGFPACMPTGVVEVPPRPAKHTHTGSYNPHIAQPTGTAGARNVPGPTITAPPDTDNSEEKSTDDQFVDVDRDGIHDDDDPNASYPDYSGRGAIIGGLVGGIFGLLILGTCIFFTGKHYRKKLLEEQAREEEFFEQNGGGGEVAGAASPSSSNWETWAGKSQVDPVSRDISSSTSGSNTTLAGTPPAVEIEEAVVIDKVARDNGTVEEDTNAAKTPQEPEEMPSPKFRPYTADSGVAMPPPATATSLSRPPLPSKASSWRQYLEPDDSSSVLFCPRSPSLSSRPNSPMVCPKSPRLGPRLDSSGSMAAPKSPRLAASPVMTGALHL